MHSFVSSVVWQGSFHNAEKTMKTLKICVYTVYNDPMYGFNGWHILSSLVLFVDSWYSKVIEIKLMNYFSLASQNSKLERNEIILHFIRNKGNYLKFLEFSQFRRRSILQQKEICEAYTFHIIFTIQWMKHKNNVLLQILQKLLKEFGTSGYSGCSVKWMRAPSNIRRSQSSVHERVHLPTLGGVSQVYMSACSFQH